MYLKVQLDEQLIGNHAQIHLFIWTMLNNLACYITTNLSFHKSSLHMSWKPMFSLIHTISECKHSLQLTEATSQQSVHL